MIDAYRLVKRSTRRSAGARRLDGARRPGGWEFYNQTVAYAGGDPDIYILSNLNNVGSVEVNAFQVHSAAVIQKSIREGFGLTVSEALWKGGRRSAGTSAASSTRSSTVRRAGSCRRRASARRCMVALGDPELARRMALAGKEHVRRHFLTPRLLRDWLALFNRMLGLETEGVELATAAAG